MLNFRQEWHLGKHTRLTGSDRLEGLQDDSGHATVRNALRETYVSVGFGEDWFAAVGCIIVRSGVGLGFYPTDWLREGASLPQTTQNPASQRENRLGTAMLKLQTVQTWGASTARRLGQLRAEPSALQAPLVGDAWFVRLNPHEQCRSRQLNLPTPVMQRLPPVIRVRALRRPNLGLTPPPGVPPETR